MATSTMRAVQLHQPGPPSNLQVVNIPIPVPKPGQVLIRIKAFGLNRSELLVRQFGRAPVGPVSLPRVLGVEATGVVEEAPGSEDDFSKGTVIMTCGGGMGIIFDGGYAEFTCVAKTNVIVLRRPTRLGWDVLGSLPVMLQTAHGTLFRRLKLQKGDTLLVRGATSSVGLMAMAIAKNAGAEVIGTTRRADPETAQLLHESGAKHIIVDDSGTIANAVKELYPAGVNKVLELVGETTLVDSLACVAESGICCIAGIVGGPSKGNDFSPLMMIPKGVYLTSYSERTFKPDNFPLDELVRKIEDGILPVRIGKTFEMDEIVSAHESMEKSEARGKLVVLTGM